MREVIQQKIVDSLASPVPAFTRRDVRVPAVPRKAVAVIGMRRTGKTTFADLDTAATREREARALLEAADEYKRASLRLITLQAETARDLPKAVTVHSAVAWLLGPKQY